MKKLPLVALLALLGSCNDGLLHAPASAPLAPVTIHALWSRSAELALGHDPEAYDRTDRLFLRFRGSDDVRLEQELPFAPSTAATAVRVDVPLRGTSESLDAEMELRSAGRPIFRGATSVTLSSGVATPLSFTLEPVVASLSCGTGTLQFATYGRTAQLRGAALFATGDTVRDLDVTWSAPQNAPVGVTAAGDVTALQDGDANLTCTAAGMSATRPVHVFAVVHSVEVAPATATLVIGNTLAYTATLFDSSGNAITAPRPIAWSSSSTSVATVTSAGVVTAVAAGSARISATSAGVGGDADLTVVVPATAVTTTAVNVTGSSAVLVGSVNPRGSATQAWFEWGTDSTLSTANSTTAQTIGNGTSDVTVSQGVTGLSPNTRFYFRIVASSEGGVVKGATLHFTTPRPPSVATGTLDPAVTSAYTVRGTANPNGNATQAWFEYGVNSNMSGAVGTSKQSIGSGTADVNIAATLSGLQQFTTYYYRAVASNIGGTVVGSILSFRTGGAPTLGATTASAGCNYVTTVSSSANPNGLATYGWIEYGGTSNFSSYNSTAAQFLGSGSSQVPFSATVPISGTVVYVRAVASNGFGLVRSGVISVIGQICIG